MQSKYCDKWYKKFTYRLIIHHNTKINSTRHNSELTL